MRTSRKLWHPDINILSCSYSSQKEDQHQVAKLSHTLFPGSWANQINQINQHPHAGSWADSFLPIHLRPSLSGSLGAPGRSSGDNHCQVIYLVLNQHKSQNLRLSFLVLDSSPLPLPSLAEFYPLEGLCATSKLPSCPNLPLCHTLPWSSFSPDPKSQFPPSSATMWSFQNHAWKQGFTNWWQFQTTLFLQYLEMEMDGATSN